MHWSHLSTKEYNEHKTQRERIPNEIPHGCVDIESQFFVWSSKYRGCCDFQSSKSSENVFASPASENQGISHHSCKSVDWMRRHQWLLKDQCRVAHVKLLLKCWWMFLVMRLQSVCLVWGGFINTQFCSFIDSLPWMWPPQRELANRSCDRHKQTDKQKLNQSTMQSINRVIIILPCAISVNDSQCCDWLKRVNKIALDELCEPNKQIY